MASGASTVADCPVSRLENRSTSASKRRRISSTVDFLAGSGPEGPAGEPGSGRRLIDHVPPEEDERLRLGVAERPVGPLADVVLDLGVRGHLPASPGAHPRL